MACEEGSSCESCSSASCDNAIKKAMSKISNKLLVLSGKGGVGKTTVAASLAAGFAARGLKVGLLDVDFHGPSVPRLTGLAGQRTGADADGIAPLEPVANLKVMSVAFLLEDDDAAVIWRGPMKYSAIQQLLGNTNWGELDVLVVDSPPGTGDEPLSTAQLIGDDATAVLVTTPQKLSVEDVKRCENFCRQLKINVHGIVENMSGYICPHCDKRVDIFGSGGGAALAEKCCLPLLGNIPIMPEIASGGDSGSGILDALSSGAARDSFENVLNSIMATFKKAPGDKPQPGGACCSAPAGETTMKIAIPVAEGKLSMHFGHCQEFVIFDVQDGTITARQSHTPPPHEPGVLPKWLGEMGVTHIIAGGMGQRAQQLFVENGIEVNVGAAAAEPEMLVSDFLGGTLETGENVCDH